VHEFSEADVRAEIIDPILRILGYRKGKDYSVDREKDIKFAEGKDRFVDYTLKLWQKNFWLIEAKKPDPSKASFGYSTLRQALEYATHPEIDAALVLLCDGIKIELFDREQDVVSPLISLPITDMVKRFDDLRRILGPLQVWFFYRRRILKAIDRAIEHEGNERRVYELKRIIEHHLSNKRGKILENFKKMKLSTKHEYEESLSNASIEEIAHVHFFIGQTMFCIDEMYKNLLTQARKTTSFSILNIIFPDSPRDANDFYYAHSLGLLIEMKKAEIKINWIPSWLVADGRDIDAAIRRLISYCVTYFREDQARKVILLTSTTFRRIFKILAVLLPHQKRSAEIQHLLTRYAGPEFSWEQILSSRERNMIVNWDRLTLFAVDEFVREFAKGKAGFQTAIAQQRLMEMLQLELALLENNTDYFELLKEYDFGEIHPTEASGVVYDNLGHTTLCLIKRYKDWTEYIRTSHKEDVETLACMGSWSAKEILGINKSKVLEKVQSSVLADRFFFGNTSLLSKLSKIYKFAT